MKLTQLHSLSADRNAQQQAFHYTSYPKIVFGALSKMSLSPFLVWLYTRWTELEEKRAETVNGTQSS